MKKNLLIASTMLLLCIGHQLQAENVRFRIVYDEIRKERGELYQYSERYLGVNDIVMQDETTYILQSITMVKQCDSVSRAACGKHHKACTTPKCGNEKKQCIHIAPLSEEAIMAGNTSKKAESVAKQIYRIREARISVLSGETEQAVSDLKVALSELNKLEQNLTALFVGNTYIKLCSKVIEFEIDENDVQDSKLLLMRFSKYVGPVAQDDLSGEPVYIQRQVKTGLRPESDKKNAKMIPYVVDSNISILYDGKIIYNQLEE